MATKKIKKLKIKQNGVQYELDFNLPQASDVESGITKLSDEINSTLGVKDGTSATPLAVKTVNDKIDTLETSLEEVAFVEFPDEIPLELTDENTFYIESDESEFDSATQIVANASLKTKGVVQLTNEISDSQELAVTPYAVQNIINNGSISGSGGLEIGDIGITVFPIDENQLKRRYLNGQTILIDQYQSFTEKLKTAIQQYPSLSCSESEWQEIVSNSDVGQCGKFVLDESAGTIRLPKIVMPIQGLIDLSSLGEIVNSGLPNIEGTGYDAVGESDASELNRNTVSGALYVKTNNKNSLRAAYGPQVTTDDFSLGFDASRSNPIYSNSETVQQEQIQYPYFIQVATGVEETVPAEKELTLNNPYSLLEHKIVDCKLNNLSWLRSEGQFNSGDTYSDVYNLLLSEKTTPTRDFSIKTSDEEYTDYDFVLNTTDKTFRLPLFTSERQLVEKKEPTDDDPTWYNLYSDGWLEQGGISNAQNAYVSPIRIDLLKKYKDLNYTIEISSDVLSSVLTGTYSVNSRDTSNCGSPFSEKIITILLYRGTMQKIGQLKVTQMKNLHQYPIFIIMWVIQYKMLI